MRKLLLLLFQLFLLSHARGQVAPNVGSSPSGDRNYVLERTFLVPVKASQLGLVRTIAQENQTVRYFDGLGRPVQVVELKASPGYRDVVRHIEYDGFGREARSYLPYAEQTSSNGSFKVNAKTNQSNYYKSTGWDAHVKKTAHPFSETVFEASPLNRVLEQGAPGQAWQPSSVRSATTGRTVVTEYGTNAAGDVRLWKVNSTNTGASSGTNHYAAGRLYKTVTKDENWVASSGKKGTVEEYKDFGGKVVLVRVWESNTKSLDTYYIYDDFGDLHYVVPPGYTAVTVTDNNADFNELLYAYKYDGRRRLVEKKVPGKGWEYLVYNKNDLPILTQDAVQRAGKRWSYTKYDAFGRVVSTGIYTNTTANQSTRAQVQALADAVPAQWERRPGATYTSVTFPSTASQLSERTVNYYDDYAFSGATGLPKSGITESQQVHTLLTGTRVSREDGTGALLTVHYYDARGRLLQSAGQNHLGGTDYVTNSYSFTGELLSSRHEHRASPGGTVTTVLTTHTYDHAGRLRDTRKKVNGQAEFLESRLAYNEIGQLKSRGLHSENGGTTFLSTVGYSYNERGWATVIGSGQFTEELRYEQPGTGGTAQYNGNISRQLWGHAATTNSTFTYSYDALNRLTSGASTGTVMSEVLTYDDRGNIKTLKRDGGAVVTYTYGNSGRSNRLSGLSGNANSYVYDANGNATKDRLATVFTYNHLNLPRTAVRSGVSVAFVYDALGAKLRKTATVSGTTTQRDYIGGIEYSRTGTGASVIERIATETGYLQNASGSYTPHYTLTDHLGNVRSVIKRGGSATTAQVVQKQDYYPFGKTRPILTGGINRYLYNGKEVQAELGGQLDYGARLYDPEIGRWNTVDPLAEKYHSLSPYNYAANNPLLFVDPDGRDIKPWMVISSGSQSSQTGKYVYNKATKPFFHAMHDFSRTSYGKSVLSMFMKNGQNAYGYKADKDGKYSNYNLHIVDINLSDPSDRGAFFIHNGAFGVFEENGNLSFKMHINDNGISKGELGETITHELGVHGAKIEEIIEAYKNGGMDAVNDLMKNTEGSDHQALKNRDQKHKGVDNYLKTKDELIELDKSYEQSFKNAEDDHEKYRR